MKPKVIGMSVRCDEGYDHEASIHLKHRMDREISDQTKELPSFLVMRSKVRSVPDSPFRRVEQRAVVMEFGWNEIPRHVPLRTPPFPAGGIIVAKFSGNMLERAQVVVPPKSIASALISDLPSAIVEYQSFVYPEWTHWMPLPPVPFVGDLLDHAVSATAVADYVGGEAVESP